MIDLKTWTKQFGPQFNINSVEVLRQRIRGDVIRGVKYQMPEGWHFLTVGRQHFMVADDSIPLQQEIIIPQTKRALLASVKKSTELAALIESLTREAIATESSKLTLVHVLPTGKIEVVTVADVYDGEGKLISTGSPRVKKNQSQSFDERCKRLAFKHRLRTHIFFTEKHRGSELDAFLTAQVPEDKLDDVKTWLKRRCIYCGQNKRSKNPKLRPQAKYCDDVCEKAFKDWLNKSRKHLKEACYDNETLYAQLEILVAKRTSLVQLNLLT